MSARTGVFDAVQAAATSSDCCRGKDFVRGHDRRITQTLKKENRKEIKTLYHGMNQFSYDGLN